MCYGSIDDNLLQLCRILIVEQGAARPPLEKCARFLSFIARSSGGRPTITKRHPLIPASRWRPLYSRRVWWEKEGYCLASLVDRTEFRNIVLEVVKCLRKNLDRPGHAPLNADQIMFWLQNVTYDDLRAATEEIDAGSEK